MKSSTQTIVQHRSSRSQPAPVANGYDSAAAASDRDRGREAQVPTYTPHIRWPDLVAQLFVHGGALYGLWLMITAAHIYTTIWAFALVYTSGFGITAGAHRLWSHRAYKAKWPLRLLLVFLFTIAGQRHVHAWALDHRVHHKYSETDSDPHDARRGFWFSHVGWLVLTPHPDVVEKRMAVDMSDLDNDPIVLWQKRLYVPLFAVLCVGIPTLVPWYYWNEDLLVAFFVGFNFRFSFTLNMAFAVNSFAHMFGARPYDKNISPVENVLVSLGALGEGWHNYHHVFPYDYKTSELGKYACNWTTAFIDGFARIGWAYDCKSVTEDMIRRRAERSGDGTRMWDCQNPVWGYGDNDLDEADFRELDAGHSTAAMSGEPQPSTDNEASSAPKPDALPPTTIRRETNWPIVLFHIYLNMSALYALVLVFTQARLYTILFSIALTLCGTLSLTIGCHRLWAHSTYKAVWPLRLLLVLWHTLCCHGTIYDWVREHRAHHKFRGTDYDRFDFRKGFLFAHILSHCVMEDPAIKREEEKVDMSDVEQDEFVMYQKKLYWLVLPVFGLLLPINAPVEYWGESVLCAVFIAGFLRITLLWHAAWLVNSANILWGLDPVDRKSADTILVFFVNKSLWPHYHYLLPWDYKSGEYGTYGSGLSTALLRVLAALGVAYDLTTCTTDGIRRALSMASTSDRPLVDCLKDSRVTASLPDILDYRQHTL